jgi:glycosyltransferase involved in cell wall biosynthesis
MYSSQKKYLNGRILTIGVPTYNRAGSLKIMLGLLGEVLRAHEVQVEVIISDNCSNDSTPNVIKKWVESQSGDLKIRTIRHNTNVGAGRNTVSLLYESSSKYFMFLGDDDRLNGENFPELIKILLESHPSAVIQALWFGKIRGRKTGAVTYAECLRLFYEYGNAWAGIIDRESAINAIESRCIRQKIEETVWPQTAFGFIAIYDLLPDQYPIAVGFEIGSPISTSLNITTKQYWVKSLESLLAVAQIVQQHTGYPLVKKRFVGLKSIGFIGHLQSILWNSVVYQDSYSIQSISAVLKNDYGWRGWLWSRIIILDKNPALLKMIFAMVHMLREKKPYCDFNEKLIRKKRQRELEIENSDSSGKRCAEWF